MEFIILCFSVLCFYYYIAIYIFLNILCIIKSLNISLNSLNTLSKLLPTTIIFCFAKEVTYPLLIYFFIFHYNSTWVFLQHCQWLIYMDIYLIHSRVCIRLLFSFVLFLLMFFPCYLALQFLLSFTFFIHCLQ